MKQKNIGEENSSSSEDINSTNTVKRVTRNSLSCNLIVDSNHAPPSPPRSKRLNVTKRKSGDPEIIVKKKTQIYIKIPKTQNLQLKLKKW